VFSLSAAFRFSRRVKARLEAVGSVSSSCSVAFSFDDSDYSCALPFPFAHFAGNLLFEQRAFVLSAVLGV